jgi:uncharacterized protein (DUF924 family)
MTATTPTAVLSFWFGNDVIGGSWQDRAGIWFSGSPELDEEINRLFGETYTATTSGELQSWADRAYGRLALIILLDQFSRNIHRGQAEAFEYDPLALKLSLDGVQEGHDRQLLPIERLFAYMPMMHAEDVDIQRQALTLFTALADEAGDESPFLHGTVNSAQEHCDIIEQFGRFPHRNAVLGRTPTSEEEAFLAEGGANFGQAPTEDS